jgi:hypothetical protein
LATSSLNLTRVLSASIPCSLKHLTHDVTGTSRTCLFYLYAGHSISTIAP